MSQKTQECFPSAEVAQVNAFGYRGDDEKYWLFCSKHAITRFFLYLEVVL